MRYYYARSFKWKRAQRGVKVNDGFIGQSSHMLARNTFGVDYDNSAKMHSKLQNYAQQYERELGEYMAQIAPMFNGLSEGEIDQKLMAMHDEKYNEGKPIHRKYSLYGILCLLLMFSSDMIFLTFFKSLFILSPIVVIISLILVIYFFTKGGKALDVGISAPLSHFPYAEICREFLIQIPKRSEKSQDYHRPPLPRP